MKIGSFNIRGLGSSVKKDELHTFFTKHNLDVCCVQETKMTALLEREGWGIWKSLRVGWCVENAAGRSGGLLSFWDEQKFNYLNHWGIRGAIVVIGCWRDTGEEFCIINVYAPCTSDDKALLWDRLTLVVGQNSGVNICIIGDFNSILSERERVGVGENDMSRDRRVFSEFVVGSNLLDVNLCGRKFTWYSSRGTCKSRLDRALINDLWASKWQDTELRRLPRSVSDHCPIVLTTRNDDWGPKPFRFVNAWLSCPGFRDRVVASWNEGGIEGWGSFVVKEIKTSKRGSEGLEFGAPRIF